MPEQTETQSALRAAVRKGVLTGALCVGVFFVGTAMWPHGDLGRFAAIARQEAPLWAIVFVATATVFFAAEYLKHKLL